MGEHKLIIEGGTCIVQARLRTLIKAGEAEIEVSPGGVLWCKSNVHTVVRNLHSLCMLSLNEKKTSLSPGQEIQINGTLNNHLPYDSFKKWISFQARTNIFMKNSDEMEEEYLEGLLSHLRSRIEFFGEYDYSIPGLRAGLEACLANPQRERLAREFAYLLQFAYSARGKTSEAKSVRASLPESKDAFIEGTVEAVSMAARDELDNSVLCALLNLAGDRNSVLSAIKVFSQMAFFFDHHNTVVPKTFYLAEISLCQVFPNRKSKLSWEVPRIKLQKTGSTKVKMLSETDKSKCEIEKMIRSSWADEKTQLGEVSIQVRKTNDEFVSAKARGSECLSHLLACLNVSRCEFKAVDSGELKVIHDEFNIRPNKDMVLHIEEFVNDACKNNKLSESMHCFQNGEIIEIHLYDNLIYDPMYYPNKTLNVYQKKILEERKRNN